MKYFLIFFLALWSSCVFGQRRFKSKITIDQVAQIEDDVFKDASATILYRNIYLQFGSLLEVREARKIYNNEGLDNGNWEIPYEDVKIVEAKTYNLDSNGNLIETSVSKDQIFTELLEEGDITTKVVFPKVKKGSVIEIIYKVEDIGLWTINYQAPIPIKEFKLTLTNPFGYYISVSKNGYSPIILNTKNTHLGVEYTGENIPGLEYEPYIGSVENYFGRLTLEILMINRRDKIRTWNDVGDYYHRIHWTDDDIWTASNRNFRDLLSDGKFFRTDVQRVVANETDPKEKAKKIFTYVRDYMEWDNKYFNNFGKRTKEVYKNKKGSSGEINLILTTMLREAGLNANLMLVASKNRGFIHFLTANKFNNTIVCLEIDEEDILLDASRKYAGFGELPLYFVNGDGLIIYNKRVSRLVSTQTSQKSHSISTIDVKFNLNNLSFSGNVKKRLTSYFAWNFREDLEEENDLDNLKESLNISNYTTKDVEDVDVPVSVFYDFNFIENIESIEDKILFEPLLFFGLNENPLKSNDRIYPLDFEFPFAKRLVFNYKVPEGYEIDNLPGAKSIHLANGLGGLDFNCTQKDNNIQVLFNLNINKGLIFPEHYTYIKGLFAEYVNISKSKIILKKI